MTTPREIIAEALRRQLGFNECGHVAQAISSHITTAGYHILSDAELAARDDATEEAISAARTYCWERYKGREPFNFSSPAVFTSHEYQKIEEYIRAHLSAIRAMKGGKP